MRGTRGRGVQGTGQEDKGQEVRKVDSREHLHRWSLSEQQLGNAIDSIVTRNKATS
jgi:hypothetical protein